MTDSPLTISSGTGTYHRMTPPPKDNGDRGWPIGCLVMVAVLVLPVALRAILARGETEPSTQVAPTSTTLAPDEAAKTGCYWWRNYLDGPLFGKDELTARIEYATERAKESSVWAVAHAAEQDDQASTMQELDVASDALDEACRSVGQ